MSLPSRESVYLSEGRISNKSEIDWLKWFVLHEKCKRNLTPVEDKGEK